MFISSQLAVSMYEVNYSLTVITRVWWIPASAASCQQLTLRPMQCNVPVSRHINRRTLFWYPLLDLLTVVNKRHTARCGCKWCVRCLTSDQGIMIQHLRQSHLRRLHTFTYITIQLGFERYRYWDIGYWPILASVGWYWHWPNSFLSNRAQYWADNSLQCRRRLATHDDLIRRALA